MKKAGVERRRLDHRQTERLSFRPFPRRLRQPERLRRPEPLQPGLPRQPERSWRLRRRRRPLPWRGRRLQRPRPWRRLRLPGGRLRAGRVRRRALAPSYRAEPCSGLLDWVHLTFWPRVSSCDRKRATRSVGWAPLPSHSAIRSTFRATRRLGAVLGQHRVVAADLLDELAVTGRVRVGDDDVVVGALLGAAAGQTNLQHFKSLSR